MSIRYARADDEIALQRLAALDSAEVPAAPLLVASVDGELRAALSLASAEVVADPFHLTLPLIELLRVRATHLPRAGHLKGSAGRQGDPGLEARRKGSRRCSVSTHSTPPAV